MELLYKCVDQLANRGMFIMDTTDCMLLNFKASKFRMDLWLAVYTTRHCSTVLGCRHIYMHQNMISPDGQPMCIYGDTAYPLTAHVNKPHRGKHLTPQEQAINTAMSGVRQCVEWEFGKVVRLWSFLDFEKIRKLFLSPVGKLYMVGVLLTKCHACLHGSETSQYFQVNPQSLEDYLH